MPAALEATRLSLASLPVIDVLDLTSSNIDARRAVGSRLRAACLDKGFFYIKNHGVEESLVESVFSEAAAFFALPAEQKALVDKARSNANRGYEALQGQTLEPGAPPDLKEGYYIGPEHTPDDRPQRLLAPPRRLLSALACPRSGDCPDLRRSGRKPPADPWRAPGSPES